MQHNVNRYLNKLIFWQKRSDSNWSIFKGMNTILFNGRHFRKQWLSIFISWKQNYPARWRRWWDVGLYLKWWSPITYVCIPQRPTYSTLLLRYEKIGLRRPFWKMAAMVIRMPIRSGPISRFFLNIWSNVCTKFGACITKWTIC